MNGAFGQGLRELDRRQELCRECRTPTELLEHFHPNTPSARKGATDGGDDLFNGLRIAANELLFCIFDHVELI